MLLDFFAGFTAGELIVLVAGAIFSILQVFYPAISPIQWFKNLTSWGDLKIKLVVQGFFFGISVLAMWLTGELALNGLTLKVLMVYFGTWYGWSQLAFATLSTAARAALRRA